MEEFPEESSWTFYIEGFNNSDNNSDEFESPSLVSDAASCAVKGRQSSSNNLGFNSTTFKKHKAKLIPAAAILNCDLEDTASSPVNSPKVSYINQFMKEKAKVDVSEVKRNSFGKAGVEKDTDQEKKTLYN